MLWRKSRSNRLPRTWIIAVVIICLLIMLVVLAKQTYNNGLRAVSSNPTTQIFTVEKGSSVQQIAAELEEARLIRSAWAMRLYVRSKGLGDNVQAGTYALSPNQSTPQITGLLTKGRVTTRLITILPGRRIDQVRADLINYGFPPEEVDQALVPEQYKDLPVIGYKPADVRSLEGLLWPESFQRDSATTASHIIRQSLTLMGQHLTPDIQAAFAKNNLTVYQGVIMASIVLQEVHRPADQAQAAQVFLTRLKSGHVLGSDATPKYGAILAGRAPSLTYDSPYNSHLHPGLPPTPISTISANALNAAANPASTNWLYFVSGDDGTTYFSTNLQEHEALTKKYCHALCNN